MLDAASLSPFDLRRLVDGDVPNVRTLMTPEVSRKVPMRTFAVTSIIVGIALVGVPRTSVAAPASPPASSRSYRGLNAIQVGQLSLEQMDVRRTRVLRRYRYETASFDDVEFNIRSATLRVGPAERAVLHARLTEALLIARFAYDGTGRLLSVTIPKNKVMLTIDQWETPPTVLGVAPTVIKRRQRLRLETDLVFSPGGAEGRIVATMPALVLKDVRVRNLNGSTFIRGTFRTAAPVEVVFDWSTLTTHIRRGMLTADGASLDTSGAAEMSSGLTTATARNVQYGSVEIHGGLAGEELVVRNVIAEDPAVSYAAAAAPPLGRIAELRAASIRWPLRSSVFGDPTAAAPRIEQMSLHTTVEEFLNVLHGPDVREVLVPTGDPNVRFCSSRALWNLYRTLAVAHDRPETHRVIKLDVAGEAVIGIRQLTIDVPTEAVRTPALVTFMMNVNEFPEKPLDIDPQNPDAANLVATAIKRALFPVLARKAVQLSVVIFLRVGNPFLATGLAFTIVGATYLTTELAGYAGSEAVDWVADKAVEILAVDVSALQPVLDPFAIVPISSPEGTARPILLPTPTPQPHPTPAQANTARYLRVREGLRNALSAPPPIEALSAEAATYARSVGAEAAITRASLERKDAIWRAHRQHQAEDLTNEIATRERARQQRIAEVAGDAGSQSDRTAATERAIQDAIKRQSGRYVGPAPSAPGTPGNDGTGQGGTPGGSFGGPPAPGAPTSSSSQRCERINEECYRYEPPPRNH